MKEFNPFSSKKNTLFYQQYKEAEEYNKTIPDEDKYPTYQTKETVWHSKLINTKEIVNSLDLLGIGVSELNIQEDREREFTDKNETFLKDSEEITPIEIKEND